MLKASFTFLLQHHNSPTDVLIPADDDAEQFSILVYPEGATEWKLKPELKQLVAWRLGFFFFFFSRSRLVSFLSYLKLEIARLHRDGAIMNRTCFGFKLCFYKICIFSTIFLMELCSIAFKQWRPHTYNILSLNCSSYSWILSHTSNTGGSLSWIII